MASTLPRGQQAARTLRAAAQSDLGPRWKEEGWIESASRAATHQLWRAVEAQHRVATMALVDNLDEQNLLEQMLESSKPPLPPDAAGLGDFLLVTPFRYTSQYPSRFRAPHERGVWYGAETIETTCAEVGYWRWRFLVDSDGLRSKELRAELTIFQAQVKGRQIDLTSLPWQSMEALWRAPKDYAACHELASQARTAGVQWIRYRSARWPQGICGAMLTPKALERPHPERVQTWLCRISSEAVHFHHDQKWISFQPQKDGMFI